MGSKRKRKMVKRQIKSALSVVMVTALILGFVPGTDFGMEAHAATTSSGTNITLTADGGSPNSNNAEGFDKLIDGKIETKWCTSRKELQNSTRVYWVEFHSESPIQVEKYTLFTAGDTATHSERNPKDWKLYAKSKTSDEWTLIDTVENDNVLQATNNTPYTFDTDVKGTWQYFRFIVSAVKVLGNPVQLSELSFSYENTQNELGTIFDDGCKNHLGQSPDILIDGDIRSKWYCGKSFKSKPSGENRDSYWLDFHTDKPIKVNQYTLTTGDDNETWKGRNPKSWVIKAKANQSDSWTVIAEVTNDTVLEDKNFAQYTFKTSREGTWQYFRFMAFESKGEGTICDGMQLCELSFSYTEPEVKASISFEEDAVKKEYGDAPFTIAFTNTGDGKVTYSSDNEEVATVDPVTGEVTIVDVGHAAIFAKLTKEDAEKYESEFTYYTLDVEPGVPKYEVPTGITLEYGQSNREIELPEGWTWAETVSFYEIGEGIIAATFTHEDRKHYKPVNVNIPVKVVEVDKTELDKTIQAANDLYVNMPSHEYYSYIKNDSKFINLMYELNDTIQGARSNYSYLRTRDAVNTFTQYLTDSMKAVNDRIDEILKNYKPEDPVTGDDPAIDPGQGNGENGSGAGQSGQTPANTPENTPSGQNDNSNASEPGQGASGASQDTDKQETNPDQKPSQTSGSEASATQPDGTGENGNNAEQVITSENADQVHSSSDDQVKETVDKKQKNTKVSKLKAGKKSVTVTWKKQTAKGIKGYQIQYSTDKKFKNNVKNVTISKTKTTSKTIKKLQSKKKYYVRIRTYKKSGSEKIYSSWSKTKSIKVK